MRIMTNKCLIKKETNRGDINLMKRRTTTRQLSEAITNGLLQVVKAECYYKTSRKTDVVETDKFLEDLQFLCEADVFMDCVGWHCQKDYKTNQYIAETGRMDGDSENIITIHMRVNEGVKTEDIEKMLLMKEED